VRAPVDEIGHGLRFGGDPVPAEVVGQQVGRLGRAQQVERDRPRTLAGHQAGQLAAAGDQHQAGGAGRQQRADLVGVARVVQHDEHPPVGQQPAVEGGPGVQAGRDPVRWHGERVEEPANGLGGVHRVVLAVEAAQVHVELAVRELGPALVRPVHGQGGLADATAAVDGADHHRLPGHAPEPAQGGQFRGAADEVRGSPRQLPRHRRVRGGPRRPAGEDPPVHLAQRRAGVDAQLLGEHLRDPPVAVERLGLPARPVQRAHELPPEVLAQRVAVGQLAQFGDEVVVPAQCQVRFDALLGRGQLPFEQTGHDFALQPLGRDVDQRFAPPQGECLGQQRGHLTGVGGRLGPPDQSVEVAQVQVGLGDLDQVAVRARPDGGRAQGVPQPHDQVVQGRAAGRVAVPHPCDQHVQRDHPVGVHQQSREHRALPGRPDRQR
jgi:hypothetical protein